jgi:DNA (cytosine-5)-methyltransferase 3A
MKVLSLFDGISCARVALDRSKHIVERYFASEIDKYAIQISEKNHKDIIHIGDVKMVAHKDAPIHYKLNDIDLLIGGSPCQDLSIAKKNRKGLDGERSGLFWEFVRILKEVKPKYFILENVNSMPKEAKQIITETLGVEPIMINASLVSAQNRKRLFWTNILNVILPQDKGILLKDILQKKVDDKYTTQMNFAKRFDYTIHQRPYNKKGQALRATDYKGTHNMIRVGKIGKGGQGDRVYSPDGKSVSLSALGGGRGAKTGLYAVAQRGRNIVDGKRKDVLGAKTEQRLEIGGNKANSLTSVFKDSMVLENSIVRKLTPIECERLQGLPDNYTEGVSNSQRYKMLGNAFNVDVVSWILSFIPRM